MLVIALLLLAANTFGHICILQPAQRGNLSSPLSAGDGTCFRRVAPCGGQPAQTPVSTYYADKEAEFLFQQNLNHWWNAEPGRLDVSLCPFGEYCLKEEDFRVLVSLSDYPAHEQVTQTNFSVRVRLPDVESDHAVLRFRYISNNQDEIYPKDNLNAVFWQCADVRITKKKRSVANRVHEAVSAVAALVDGEQHVIAADPNDCCAPQKFQMKGFEVNPGGTVVHAVYWDLTRNLTRWDKGSLSLYNNYTNGNEFVYDQKTGKCVLFGNDRPYGWCFGSSASMVYVGQGPNATSLWKQGNGIEFGSTQASCYPSFLQSQKSGWKITFSDHQPLVSSSVFNIPAVCHTAKKQRRC